MENEIYKRKFVWFPEYVVNGVESHFDWRWLTFGWYRWHEGWYEDFWMPVTHNLNDYSGKK